MNNQMISEDDLHAYVDGMLDDARIVEVEAWLENHPDRLQEILDWKKQNEMIGTLFDHVAEERVPHRLDPYAIAAQQKATVSGWQAMPGWQAMAAVLAVAVFSGAVGWFGHGLVAPERRVEIAAAQSSGMVAQALEAHAVYSVEVLHPVEVLAGNEKHLVKWLSKRLGEKINAPDLGKEGFALIGGRLLPASSGPAAQFMYEDSEGRRITLYAARNASKSLASFQFAKKDGVQAFYWLTSDLSYALVGTVKREELLQLSHRVYDQLS